MPSEHRPPTDLRGLLRFCMTAGADPAPSGADDMDPERRAWLEEALGSMAVDVAGRMRELIRAVLNHAGLEPAGGQARASAVTEAEALAALEALVEWTEDVNFSIDFMKIGGFDLVDALLDPARALGPSVRAWAAALLAAVVQNNPPCQDYLVAHMAHLLVLLLRLLDSPATEPAPLRLKALAAVSCSVREHAPALDVFLNNDGLAALLRALETHGELPLQTKAAFLLGSLASESDRLDDAFLSGGYVARAAALLDGPHLPWHEHLLRALLLLVQRSAAARAAVAGTPGLRAAVRRRMEGLQGGEHEESVEHARGLCVSVGWAGADADFPVLR